MNSTQVVPKRLPSRLCSLTVVILVLVCLGQWASAQSFSDTFTRDTDPGPLTPWLVHSGNWTVTGGQLQGGTNTFNSYGFAYVTNGWADYSVEAKLQFPPGAFGGGLGGRFDAGSGAHYAAWIYPENSPGGSNIFRLLKFQTWTNFGYQNISFAPMGQVSLPAVGTSAHTVKLTFQGRQVTASYDGTPLITATDTEPVAYLAGGISVEFWTDSTGYVMSVDDVLANAPPPVANNDSFQIAAGTTLTVPSPGVLANDSYNNGVLTAVLVSGPAHGIVDLETSGGFSYTPGLGWSGTDSFVYQDRSGSTNSAPATVTITVIPPGVIFSDAFSRPQDPGLLSPWIVQSGNWSITAGRLDAGANPLLSYGSIYITNQWTNYAAQAKVQFSTNAFGGGLSGRVNPASGARYGAWVYPENSTGLSNVLALIKFQNWTSFGYTNSSFTPMAQTSLPAVGTNWHDLKLAFSGDRVCAYFDGNQLLSVTDAEAQPHNSGAIGLDMWTDSSAYRMAVDDALVTVLAIDDNYSVDQDMTLNVSAPGVLANDTGVYDTNLTAVLLAGPTNGLLTLNSNGGFIYAPATNSPGLDSFSYEAHDGHGILGTATVTLLVKTIGPSRRIFSENFDGVTTPGLPAGWTSTASGAQTPWVTQGPGEASPNAVHAGEPANEGISELISPAIPLPAGPSQVSFANNYNLEGNLSGGADGGVLEIQIAGGAFTDIIEAGGTFLAGGYDHTGATGFDGPFAGRRVWSGNSSGFIQTTVNLPAAAFGHSIRLRWRCASDNHNSGEGWLVDTVVISNCPCACCWNTAPMLPSQSDMAIAELTSMTVTNSATDLDVPANVLTYQLLAGPTNAVISAEGVISWTPNEMEGPGTNLFTTVVSDNGTPSLTATNSFVVTVLEVNSAPVLASQADHTIAELSALVVTNSATDSDIPANNLTYELVNAPGGAAINASGVITWTPSEAQGPSTNIFETVVTDNGVPPLSATNTFVVAVIEVNSAPVLPLVSDHTIAELTPLVVTNSATDPDLPTNVLSYALQNAPNGAAINTNGIITWTPASAQAPSTNVFETVATDNGTPALSATNRFNVVVTIALTRPLIEWLRTTNDSATVTWTSVAGQKYRLQFKNRLSDPAWNEGPEVIADGAHTSVSDPVAGLLQRFYRIMVVP